jgi:integrase
MPQHLIRKSDVARLLQEPVTKSKKFPDGAGLYLEIRRQKNGNVKGYWTVQLSLGDGRRPQWFNIGPVGLFSIDQAREAHAQMKRDRALDRVSSRLDAIRAEPASEVITFQKAAMAYLDMQRGHDIGEAQYRDHLSRLKAFVFPSIGHLAIDRIKQSDIVRLLQPIWKGATTNGKAVKVRSLIERVLNTAKLPDGSQLPQPNVAAWSRLQGDLHKASAAVEHHAAMKYQDVPGFYQTLKADGSSASRAIMLLILTGCRLGEVIRTERSLGAQWDHIDYTANLWTIPAENHKTGRKTGEARVVTLTDEMKAVLGPHRGHGSVFNGGASKQTLLNVLEAHGVDATNHGFRSSCKDYLRGPLVRAPLDLAELALGHKRRGVESAYGSIEAVLPLLHDLMEKWSHYVAGE